MKRAEGKIGVVTGAGSGNGRGIAIRMAQDGARAVVVSDIDGSSAESVAAEIRDRYGTKAKPVTTDVAKESDVQGLFDTIVHDFGRLDILVHCPAVISIRTVCDETVETWDQVFAVNVRGAFLCCRAAARQMRDQRSGRILIASSGAGQIGVTYMSCYSATKAALIRFGEVLAREMGPYGVCVNVFSPGWSPWSKIGQQTCEAIGEYTGVEAEKVAELHTKGIPLGREGTPEDAANLVSFLYSEEAGYITGQMIGASGGVSAGRDLIRVE